MSYLNKFFKKNSFIFGSVLAVSLSVLIFFILYFLNIFLGKFYGTEYMIKESTIQLVSIFINLLPMRYYFVKLKFDKTGRGILLIMFITGIFYFILMK